MSLLSAWPEPRAWEGRSEAEGWGAEPVWLSCLLTCGLQFSFYLQDFLWSSGKSCVRQESRRAGQCKHILAAAYPFSSQGQELFQGHLRQADPSLHLESEHQPSWVR